MKSRVLFVAAVLIAAVIALYVAIARHRAARPISGVQTDAVSHVRPSDGQTPPHQIGSGKARDAKATIRDELDRAIASKSRAQEAHAFAVLYTGRDFRSDEVIAVLKSYLTDSDLFVRFEAARWLLWFGDKTGVPVLIAMVGENRTIDDIGGDLRYQAAFALAKFHIAEADEPIVSLYKQTHEGNILGALISSGSSAAAPLVQAMGYFSDWQSLQAYGRAGVTAFSSNISATFRSSVDPEQKLAAAWALAEISNDRDAIDYLVQQASPTLDASQPLTTQGMLALKYLGSVQAPQAIQTLEGALNSPKTHVADVAVVNLLFNQNSSDKAIDAIAARLEQSATAKVSLEIALEAASKFTDVPRIQSAGSAYDQQHQDGLWHTYSTDRTQRPIFGWIDNYVVKLNGK